MKTKLISLLFGMFASISQPSHIGLTNQGATCYQNALLQAIHKCSPLRTALLEQIEETDTKRDPIINPFKTIMTNLSKDSRTYNPKIFARNACNVFFEGNKGQQDSQELLSGLWNYFQEKKLLPNSTPKPEEGIDPLLCQWAGVEVAKKVQCNNCCNIRSGAIENSFMLSLPMPVSRKHFSIDAILNEFTRWGHMNELDRKYDAVCESCKTMFPHNEKVDLSIDNTMSYLVLHLKRFATDMYGRVSSKIHTPVKFDPSGIIRIYDKKNKKAHRFAVTSVVVHFGGSAGGHYICVTREGVYNDDDVTPDGGAALQKLLAGSGDGYLYFLERVE